MYIIKIMNIFTRHDKLLSFGTFSSSYYDHSKIAIPIVS